MTAPDPGPYGPGGPAFPLYQNPDGTWTDDPDPTSGKGGIAPWDEPDQGDTFGPGDHSRGYAPDRIPKGLPDRPPDDESPYLGATPPASPPREAPGGRMKFPDWYSDTGDPGTAHTKARSAADLSGGVQPGHTKRDPNDPWDPDLPPPQAQYPMPGKGTRPPYTPREDAPRTFPGPNADDRHQEWIPGWPQHEHRGGVPAQAPGVEPTHFEHGFAEGKAAAPKFRENLLHLIDAHITMKLIEGLRDHGVL